MATNNHDNHPSLPEDPLAIQADSRLRELLSSLPVSVTEANFEHRVLAKVRRRQMATRATYAAALIVLLAASWWMLAHGRDSQHAKLVGNEHSPADSLAAMDEVESARNVLEQHRWLCYCDGRRGQYDCAKHQNDYSRGH